MKTYSGIAPLPDNNEAPNPIDIVFHLGRTRRFGGWGNPEWTVLHHSLLVSLIWLRYLGPEGLQFALLHDAHEYITGDIPSPVKHAIGPGARELEKELDRRVYARLGLEQPSVNESLSVRVVDLAALFIESYRGFGPKGTFGHLRQVDWPTIDEAVREQVLGAILGVDEECYDAMTKPVPV